MRKKTRSTLTLSQSFALMKLIEAEYATANKTDVEFAAYAAESLNIPELNDDHITLRRNELGLSPFSNRPRKVAHAAKLKIEELERRLGVLEQRVNVYLSVKP